MSAIINHKSSIINHQRGVALLVVLMVVMAITLLSLGFLSRCDMALACGRNVLLRTQMDQLADSGLEHARGLVLHPHDLSSEYWTGAAAQQLESESTDYYDVSVTRDDSDPDERRNYAITCEAYRLKDAQKVGSSRLAAELRLDPCVALWIGTDAVFQPKHVLQGDLYSTGTVTVLGPGIVNGDVFSNALTGTVAGHHKPVTDLSLAWPPVTRTYASPHYAFGDIVPDTLSMTSYEPARIWRHTGDLTIDSTVVIRGMLLVDGNLTFRGSANLIAAAKNLPALYVSGDLAVEEVNDVRIEGLTVVDGSVRISASASNIHILGGLFVKRSVRETASDSSGGDSDCTVHGAPAWRPAGGARQGALEFGGVNDYLQTRDSVASLQLTADYTIALYIRPAASQKASAGIVAKTNAVGSTNHWALQFDAANPMALWVHHPTGSWATAITLADMAQDKWYHVAVVRQGNTMSSYLDGTRLKQETWDIAPGSGSGHLNVAADRTGLSERFYAGLIDDVRVYNQAVAVVPPLDSAPGLIGRWRLDESGSEVTIVAEPARSAVVASGTPEQHWGQATGAFYRSIRRN